MLDEQIAQMTNNQEFTRLCNAIFSAVHPGDFQVVDGTRGDAGNDGYVWSEERILAFYCPTKPEKTTDADYLKKAQSDLTKAVKIRDSGQLRVKAWSFVTPRKLAHKVLVELEAEAQKSGLTFVHLESTYLSGALLAHGHLIKEFPELHVSQMEEVMREALEKLPRDGPNAVNPDAAPAVENHVPQQPSLPGIGSDPAGAARVEALGSRICSQEEKAELRAIAYGSSDPAVQVNAIVALSNAYGPADDNANDLITLCEFGQQLVRRLHDPAVEGFLTAMVGYVVSFQHSMLYLQLWASDQADRAIGMNLTPPEQRERTAEKLAELKQRYRAAFSAALELTARENDVKGYAGVLILLGNAAGQRATGLRGLGAKDAAEAELSVSKTALMNARTLFASIGNEREANNALFNLAIQIHYHGEINEAKTLTRKVLEIAAGLNDAVVMQKAKWLMETLEGGKIPDYAKGERRKVDPVGE